MNAAVTSRRLPVGSSGLNFTGATPFLLAARTADLELMRVLLEARRRSSDGDRRRNRRR